jgi:hypothetical protein
MSIIPTSVFLLCLVTSAACAWLLFRQYRHTRTNLVFWSALCFLALTANNALVFVDLVVFPDEVSLLIFRNIASLAAVGVLLYGFIWESD